MERRAPRLLSQALVALITCAAAAPAAAQVCTNVITVRSTADTAGTCPGPSCTLRQAIAEANAAPDCTRIAFDFAPAPGGTIHLVSPLPTITTPVEIDGWTHPNSQRISDDGFHGPIIRVAISGATNGVAGSGLRLLDVGYALIQGIVVDGFASGAAIEVAASTNADQHVTIRENQLGKMAAGFGAGNRVGVSVQARGVHIGGGPGTPGPGVPGIALPDPLDPAQGNLLFGNTGPAVHVTTSPFGIHGRARVIGNHVGAIAGMLPQQPLIVDLGPEGRTPNDPGDPDAGPNDLQNFPDVRAEFVALFPAPGDPPCGPATGYGTCDTLRITVRLTGAPAGTYTAELLAGGADPTLGDGGEPRYLLTGMRTRTGSGDLDFVFELHDGYNVFDAYRDHLNAGGLVPAPFIRALVSQEGATSFAGATSEISLGPTQGSTPPPDPGPTYSRYFAEGASGSFFDTTFSLSNFGTTAANATLTFHTDAGQTVSQTLTVPAGGRPVTVLADTVAGLNGASFGTTITADQLLVTSRTMTWDASGYGSHADNGVPAPRTRWFLAEGVTGAFDTYVLVYNPTGDDATIAVSFNRVAPHPPIVRTYTVAARRRLTIPVDTVDPALSATDVAIDVTSTNSVPVVVERSVYLSSPTTVYEAGTGSSAGDVGTIWYFGEGTATATFDTFLLFYNPNATAASVDVTYLRRSGAPLVASYTVQPGNRLSIWTDLIAGLENQDFGMVVTSTNGVPIAAERAMWGGGAPFIDGHASQGLSTPSIRWGLNGGEANAATGADTYVLIVNPTTTNATAQLTLSFEDGTTSPPRTVSVPAQRRANVSIVTTFPEASGRRFSILVESVGGGTPALVVERSTYTSPGAVWRAGSNETGTPLP